MERKCIKLSHLSLPQGKMIALSFPMEKMITDRIKELPGRKWNVDKQCVYVKNTRENVKEIFAKFKNIAWIDGKEFFGNSPNIKNNNQTIVNLITNKNTFQIFIRLPQKYNQTWINKIKTFESSYYIKNRGLWVIKGGNENYLALKKYFEQNHCKVQLSPSRDSVNSRPIDTKNWHKNKPIDHEVLLEYKKTLLLRSAGKGTIKSYVSMFTRFLAYFFNHNINALDKETITSYMLWERQEIGISDQMLNQLVNAIKYYYEKVKGGQKTLYNLPRPKMKKHLPTVLNPKELTALLSSISNIKHKCIISLLYSSGIRRAELLNLKTEDIDFDRKILFVNRGKGKKDRISILSDTVIGYLKKYLSEYKPREWLFTGQTGGQYTAASIWKIFNRLKLENHIIKKGSVHLLRHSFATNLLETGTDIRYIQALLGHNSLKTTELYTHVANKDIIKIKSPMDNLQIK